MNNVQMENGVPKIVSIKGIDNDRSMGMVDDNDAGLRGYITPPVQDDKVIHYNAASAAAEPDYLRADRGQMYVSDFSTHKQELSQMLDSLKRTESIAHWNSASYDWMRDSLKNVIAGIKAIENKYADADIPLQQEDAAKIEVLYRQMRLAAAKYVAEHRNPGYSRGITRKTCAESLAGKWPLRLGRPEPEVREINADQIAGNGGAHAPAKKSLSTALREARRAAGAPATEVPGANGAGGNAQNAAADGNELNAGVNHKSSLADLLHEEDEQNLRRSMKHRRKVKISESGEGPEDLMNSF